MEARISFGVILPVTLERRDAMSTFKLLGAVAILSTAIATPVPAQPVVSEPGYCAQFYPNANCQNKGPGNPYTDPYYRRGPVLNDGAWASDETVGVARKKARTHRSAPPARRMQ
jgi:hypothetical protein